MNIGMLYLSLSLFLSHGFIFLYVFWKDCINSYKFTDNSLNRFSMVYILQSCLILGSYNHVLYFQGLFRVLLVSYLMLLLSSDISLKSKFEFFKHLLQFSVKILFNKSHWLWMICWFPFRDCLILMTGDLSNQIYVAIFKYESLYWKGWIALLSVGSNRPGHHELPFTGPRVSLPPALAGTVLCKPASQDGLTGRPCLCCGCKIPSHTRLTSPRKFSRLLPGRCYSSFATVVFQSFLPPLIFIIFITSVRSGKVIVSSNYYCEIKAARLPIKWAWWNRLRGAGPQAADCQHLYLFAWEVSLAVRAHLTELSRSDVLEGDALCLSVTAVGWCINTTAPVP